MFSIPWLGCLLWSGPGGHLPGRYHAHCQDILGVIAEGPCGDGWRDIEKMKEVEGKYSFRLIWKKESTIPEYDRTHWREERKSAVRDAGWVSRIQGKEDLELKWQVQKACLCLRKCKTRWKNNRLVIMGFIFLLWCNIFTQELFMYGRVFFVCFFKLKYKIKGPWWPWKKLTNCFLISKSPKLK